MGGDHYITLPILRAYAEKFGPLSVIHFDAHSDLWPDDDMTRIDHGTMMYKAVKQGYVDPKRSVQIGIRTTTEDYLGFNVIDARWVHENGTGATVARIKDIVAIIRPTSPSTSTRWTPRLPPAPARRSGADYIPGKPPPSCATLRASTWSAAILSRSRRPMTPPEPPRSQARMWDMN